MQEAEEQDTCRICSAPAEIDQPLFHPCKCSGTIRYIHQDCLTTWLAHSKKKNCDVCKHPYTFTKVYAPDMPSTLPPVLVVRRLAQQALFGLLFVMRAIAVATIWLAVLPWATVWTWRMYFSMGESTAWWISDRPRPTTSESSAFYFTVSSDISSPPSKTFVGRLTSHPLWIALSADIFTGQIIASLIVLTFVAIFLLREWISQNARPGVFEDEEGLPDDQAAQVQPEPGPIQPRPRVQHANNPLDEALAQRQIEALRAIDALRARDGVNGHIVGDERHLHGRSPIERPKRKGKDRQKAIDPLIPSDSDFPRTRRRLLPKRSGEDNTSARDFEQERLQKLAWFRRVQTARVVGARRRAALAAARGTRETNALQGNPKFDFTFRARDRQPHAGRRSSSEPREKTQPDANDTVHTTSVTLPTTPIFPPVTLQPPRATIPFSFGQIPTPPVSPPLSSDEPDKNLISSASSSILAGARRPRLPPTTIPASGFASSSVSLAGTPLDSPSLVTYRPPEEFDNEAGPSNLDGYFGRDAELAVESSEESSAYEEEMQDRQELMDQYFQDPGETPFNGNDSTDEGEDQILDIDGEIDASDDGTAESDDGDIDDEEEDEDEDDDNERDVIGLRNRVVDGEGQWEVQADDGVDQVVAQGPVDVRQEGAAVAEAPLEGVPPEVGDEMEGNVEDDMEGAMEAIGMRGPIYGVIQNAALMIFVLDTAIGLGVWIPFTIGKSAALLSLEPPRFLQLLHLPIRAIRIVTDPVVDSIAFFLVELVFPPFVRLARRSFGALSVGLFFSVRKVLGHSKANGLSALITKMESRITDISHRPLEQLFAWSSSQVEPKKPPHAASANSLLFFNLELPDVISKAEPYFAILGKEVRLGAAQLRTTWTRLALGEGPSERAFAVLLGYAVVGLLLALYLNVLTVGNAKSAGRAVRSAVRQQLLVFKVAAFIFIELVTFPLACGIVLDLCTVWLFPEANLVARAAFFLQAPLTAMFYHWVAGTMFMYSFAVLLSGCRSVMRPGAMWFVKDPQDQNSHPIRDILDRPTLTQLRKICVSGIMYSCVVACVVGSVAGLLLVGSKSIMPFRWKNREPLSNVPVDLLFLHLVLPYTMHYFRPKKAMKEFATVLWKYVAARLRLTSYFFGGRHPGQENTPKHWRAFSIRLGNEIVEADAKTDGTFRRVPATDNLALPRDMRATVAVSEDGEPLDDAAKDLMELQNAEAEKAKRNIKDDYMVVYIPPHFRYRVICFIAVLWVLGAIFLGLVVALPIQFGRSFFGLFTSREVHDGYALIVGFYLLWGCHILGTAIDRLDKRRQRSGGDGPRADLRILVIKRGLLWAAKAFYMAICLGIVIPTLVSFVVDLYIILPIRFTLDPEMTPKIRVVDTWALGLLYAKIALHANRIQPPNRITRGIQHITTNGWTHPDPVQATKEVIGPVTGGLLGMIIFPGIIFRLIQYLLPTIPIDDKFIFMHIYPGIFMFAGLLRSAVVLYGLLSTWSQSIRDKEFLVELRLRNHEPEKVSEKINALEGEVTSTPTNEEDVEEPDN